MTKSVRRKSNTGETKLLPQQFEVSFTVADTEFCIVFGSEQKVVSIGRRKQRLLHYIPIQHFAKLEREGYLTVLPPFTKHFDYKIIHIAVLKRKAQTLGTAKSTIKNSKRNKVRSRDVNTAGPVPKEIHDLFARQRS